VLTNIGFHDWFPGEQVFPEEEQEFSATLRAVRYARRRIDEPVHQVPAAERERDADPLYYLV
jgi:SulP family sulfate permease